MATSLEQIQIETESMYALGDDTSGLSDAAICERSIIPIHRQTKSTKLHNKRLKVSGEVVPTLSLGGIDWPFARFSPGINELLPKYSNDSSE